MYIRNVNDMAQYFDGDSAYSDASRRLSHLISKYWIEDLDATWVVYTDSVLLDLSFNTSCDNPFSTFAALFGFLCYAEIFCATRDFSHTVVDSDQAVTRLKPCDDSGIKWDSISLTPDSHSNLGRKAKVAKKKIS